MDTLNRMNPRVAHGCNVSMVGSPSTPIVVTWTMFSRIGVRAHANAESRIFVAPPDLGVGAVTGLVPELVPVPLPPRTDARGAPLRAGGRPLPLPPQVVHRARTTVSGLASVDHRGRVADRTVIRAVCK